MEKRINKKVESYITVFKDSVRTKINELNFDEKDKTNELMEFVYDYDRLLINKDDLNKRKRIKNSIPSSNRCSAKRANNEQCTRRRKENSEFCGTHSKGTPNGMIQEEFCSESIIQKVEVFAEDICGIVYYLDKFNNVYKTEDIINSKQNPQVIAKYVKDGDKYTIPELGLV
jgi:hypothetical protein